MKFNLWAVLRALITPTPKEGLKDLDTKEPTDDRFAALAPIAADSPIAVSPGVGIGVAYGTVAADTATASVDGVEALTPAAVALSDVAPGANVADVAAPAILFATLADPTQSDSDAGTIGNELENIKAISGDGIELFALIFKEAMGLAIRLGHDFGAVFDDVKNSAKDIAQKVQAQ